ncbi:MAG: hypothetical protein CMN75_06005 [Spirochaeta sp.]|nr:hypothetical protein [Spirochaeta sp.]RPG06358.1 MAG: hypothetical protein CBC32_011425 [Proteobacteria bacterium TMED72]
MSDRKDDFSLLEALLWEPDAGYFLLDSHLDRLAGSARFFHRLLDIEGVRGRLEEAAQGFTPESKKVRLEVGSKGDVKIESESIVVRDTISYAIATEPVDASDPFLQHKTSRRAVYDRALALHPEAEDVVLWNERHELTEACWGNLVLEIGGRKWTPRQDGGLLPGTFRAFLLEKGEVEEAVLPLGALKEADDVFLINSVRLWRRGVPVESR